MDASLFQALKEKSLAWRKDQAQDRIARILKIRNWIKKNETLIFKALPGLEVQTPPCLEQNAQLQDRAGMVVGSGSQVRANEIFPQWHLPRINMHRS